LENQHLDNKEEFTLHFFNEKEIDKMMANNKIWDGMMITACTMYKSQKL